MTWTTPGAIPDDFTLNFQKEFTTNTGSPQQTTISKSLTFNSASTTLSASETTDPEASGTIDAEISLSRWHTEEVGTGFKGGSIVGAQRRSVSFTLQ